MKANLNSKTGISPRLAVNTNIRVVSINKFPWNGVTPKSRFHLHRMYNACRGEQKKKVGIHLRGTMFHLLHRRRFLLNSGGERVDHRTEERFLKNSNGHDLFSSVSDIARQPVSPWITWYVRTRHKSLLAKPFRRNSRHRDDGTPRASLPLPLHSQIFLADACTDFLFRERERENRRGKYRANS